MRPFAFSHNPNIPVLTEVDTEVALLTINGKNSGTVIYSIYDADSPILIHRNINTGVNTNRSGRVWSFFTSNILQIHINFPDIIINHFTPCLALTKWCNTEKLKPDKTTVNK